MIDLADFVGQRHAERKFNALHFVQMLAAHRLAFFAGDGSIMAIIEVKARNGRVVALIIMRIGEAVYLWPSSLWTLDYGAAITHWENIKSSLYAFRSEVLGLRRHHCE